MDQKELTPLINCDDRDRQKESLKKVIKTYTKIEEISNSNNIRILYGDNKDFKAVLEELRKKINDCFENIINQIKNSTDLQRMQPLCQLAERINQEITLALYP